MLSHVPLGTSSPKLPGTVTVPGLSGWRNCRWLPRVRAWTQPSRSTSRTASRTVGKTRSVRPSKTAAQRHRAQPRTTSDRGPANLTSGVRTSGRVLDSVLRLHTYVDWTHIGRINIEQHGDRLASGHRHLVEVSRLGEDAPQRGNCYRPPLARSARLRHDVPRWPRQTSWFNHLASLGGAATQRVLVDAANTTSFICR